MEPRISMRGFFVRRTQALRNYSKIGEPFAA
jgi:hypothetical protein